VKLLIEILAFGEVGEVDLQNVFDDLWITAHDDVGVAQSWALEIMRASTVSQHICAPII